MRDRQMDGKKRKKQKSSYRVEERKIYVEKMTFKPWQKLF